MTFEQARAASQAVCYRFTYRIAGRDESFAFIEVATKREAQLRADAIAESLRRRLRLARVVRLPHPPGTGTDSRRQA
jgi:hypothetical protein